MGSVFDFHFSMSHVTLNKFIHLTIIHYTYYICVEDRKFLFPRILHSSGKRQIVSKCWTHTVIKAIKKEQSDA